MLPGHWSPSAGGPPDIFSEIEGLAKWCCPEPGNARNMGSIRTRGGSPLPFPAQETNHDRDQPSLCQARTRANRANATNISTHINTHQKWIFMKSWNLEISPLAHEPRSLHSVHLLYQVHQGIPRSPTPTGSGVGGGGSYISDNVWT